MVFLGIWNIILISMSSAFCPDYTYSSDYNLTYVTNVSETDIMGNIWNRAKGVVSCTPNIIAYLINIPVLIVIAYIGARLIRGGG